MDHSIFSQNVRRSPCNTCNTSLITMRVFQLFALLSTFATNVESTHVPIFQVTVTCDLHDATMVKSDCDNSIKGNGPPVWDLVSAILMTCTWGAMDSPAAEFSNFAAGWEIYTPHARRHLRQHQERELGTCSGTCYSPMSSCCLLDSSFCAGNCSNCDCQQRRLGNENDMIENVLASNGNDHAPRRLPNNDNLTQCEVAMGDLRDILLALKKPNFCLGEGPATQNQAAVKCKEHRFF
jgi:hypothetical protein